MPEVTSTFCGGNGKPRIELELNPEYAARLYCHVMGYPNGVFKPLREALLDALSCGGTIQADEARREAEEARR